MVPLEKAVAMKRIVDFDRPPVAETALGVVFAPLPGWSVLHFGLLWNRVRDLYPKTEVKAAAGEVELRLSPSENVDIPIRALLLDKSGNQLLQVQRNAFIRNWRQTLETPEYEHYENLRPLFERDWNAFLDFLRSEKLQTPEPFQCEVTYINHLVRGREWKTFEDASRIFRVWAGVDVGQLRTSQMISFMTAYDLPNKSGRLQAVVQPGIRRIDSNEIIQFALTATIKPSGSSLPAILNALDAGHIAVVTSFRDMTTPAMHSFWGIK